MQGSGVLVPAPSSPKLLGSGSRGGPLRTLEGVGHRHARAGTWRLPRRDPGWAEVAVQGTRVPATDPWPFSRQAPLITAGAPGKAAARAAGPGPWQPQRAPPGPPRHPRVCRCLGVGAADCSPETGWLCSVSRRLRGPGGGGKESVLRKSQALITLLLFECSETARACKSGRGSPSPQTAKLGAHSSPSWEALCPQDGGSRMVSPPTWL